MTTIIGNGLALLFIGLVVYWFWLSKPKGHKARAKEVVEIEMANGVFNPALLEVAVNTPVVLRIVRKDPSPCAEQVIFKELGIARPLSLQQAEHIELVLPQPGEYHFNCQMGMYQGRIIAR
ncbi:MAG: cupredoxin domain-containing protein [Gammaproteobacteria bacterium]|nr:cupredoxin domain-containing protein [Gammaproteobacteria bacterium]